MSALVAAAPQRLAAATLAASTFTHAPARIVLLGTGNVGQAVLSRLAEWTDMPLGHRLSLAGVANTRVAWVPASTARGRRAELAGVDGHPTDPVVAGLARYALLDGLVPTRFHSGAGLDLATAALGNAGIRILVDATASDEVARRHADWLASGVHVVTACKLGQGTCVERWRGIRSAGIAGGARYGDSATVGAGLPLLRTIRALRAGGDRIHAIAGRLSGSLAWLFHHYDGRLPFPGFVREARDAGYTEPDPREDLSGEDVRRKLLILVRAAGVELPAEAVAVASLVPADLAALPNVAVDAGLSLLDAPMRARHASACEQDKRLHFIARWQDGRARVGLEALAADDPLAGGTGTDNRLAIWSDRYRGQPLVVQGPGAGAGVTAAALLDDVLSIQGSALK